MIRGISLVIVMCALFSCVVLAEDVRIVKRYGETPWIPDCPNNGTIDGDGDCDNDHYGPYKRLKALLITSTVLVGVMLVGALSWAIYAAISYSLKHRSKTQYSKLKKERNQ
jgi:hypothetical protein